MDACCLSVSIIQSTAKLTHEAVSNSSSNKLHNIYPKQHQYLGSIYQVHSFSSFVGFPKTFKPFPAKVFVNELSRCFCTTYFCLIPLFAPSAPRREFRRVQALSRLCCELLNDLNRRQIPAGGVYPVGCRWRHFKQEFDIYVLGAGCRYECLLFTI